LTEAYKTLLDIKKDLGHLSMKDGRSILKPPSEELESVMLTLPPIRDEAPNVMTFQSMKAIAEA